MLASLAGAGAADRKRLIDGGAAPRLAAVALQAAHAGGTAVAPALASALGAAGALCELAPGRDAFAACVDTFEAVLSVLRAAAASAASAGGAAAAAAAGVAPHTLVRGSAVIYHGHGGNAFCAARARASARASAGAPRGWKRCVCACCSAVGVFRAIRQRESRASLQR